MKSINRELNRQGQGSTYKSPNYLESQESQAAQANKQMASTLSNFGNAKNLQLQTFESMKSATQSKQRNGGGLLIAPSLMSPSHEAQERRQQTLQPLQKIKKVISYSTKGGAAAEL